MRSSKKKQLPLDGYQRLGYFSKIVNFSLARYATALGRSPGRRKDIEKIEKFLDWFRKHRGKLEDHCFELYGPEIRDQSLHQLFFGPSEDPPDEKYESYEKFP